VRIEPAGGVRLGEPDPRSPAREKLTARFELV